MSSSGRKISRAEKADRVVRSKLSGDERAAAIRRACSRVKTTATIDFVRDVRGL